MDFSVREPPPTSVLMPRPPGRTGFPPAAAGSIPAIVRGRAGTRPRDIARNAPRSGGASPENSDSEKRRKPSTSSTTRPAGTSRWLTTITRTLREFGVTPDPRYWRRSRMGSSWPRTLAMPLTQGLAPGTRVRPGGTASTSRVSSRAARYSSPAMRNATPTHSRAPGFSEAAAAVTARPRRSSSARSSNGRSRSDLRVAGSFISKEVQLRPRESPAPSPRADRAKPV